MKRSRKRSKSRRRSRKHTIRKIFGARDKFIHADGSKYSDKYNTGYGEITDSAIKNIVSFLKKIKKKCYSFVDLGCGNGRSLALALDNGFEQSRGIELVEERYKFAVDSLKKISKFDGKYEIVQGDMFDLDKSFFEKDCVVFVSNLLFPADTNQRLVEFLSDKVPKDTVIFMTVIPKNVDGFEMLDKIDTPMSWYADSKCFVLQKK